ncbi:MAG: 2-C-methyl-D-erythritol 4-phosphate cytidylyltransferase [Cyanobacteriota bacterium]|nr:2-C-methyl-D-erythritol 4-phosphate cytidylyltransferase [Cyanobacteriota bacterium]
MHFLIPAAGRGRRMGSTVNKLLLPLLDRPILAWTLQAADQASSIRWIGLLAQKSDWPAMEKILQKFPLSKPVQLIEGGETRQASVYEGLKYLQAQGGISHVLIHDGARCLATPALLDRCSAALAQVDGLIAAVPVKDTIKVVISEPGDALPQIESTPNRKHLWAAQTPQGFALSLLADAHHKAVEVGWQVTDDAALFEKLGLPVHILPGEESNLKVTTPLDLAIAQYILKVRLQQATTPAPPA